MGVGMRVAPAVVAALLAIGSAANGQAQEVSNFYNIVDPSGADPWVIRHDDGRYYLIQSMQGGIVLRRSPTITGLSAGEDRLIWRPEPGTAHSKELWAPEIHRLKGGWYVYVAADDGDNNHHRMYVLENRADDPFEGTFTFKGKITDPSDKWAIDGTVLRTGTGDAERLYFVWSGWEGDKNVDQRIYIAPMSDPATISGPRVELSRPTHDWEKAAGPPTINEGPEALIHNGRVFLVYSAAGSWSDHYCLGLLALKPGADPLNASAWTKSPEPVFASANGVVAPGHNSFTKSPDGKEDWIVFHAAKAPGSGWSRSIRAQEFHWGKDGLPVFGAPKAADRPIPLPSGEPKRLRLEAEKARLEGPAKGVADSQSSGRSKLVDLTGPEARATFEVSVAKAGTYVVAVRYRTEPGPAADRRARNSHRLLVADRPQTTLVYPDSGGGRWSVAYARLRLLEGSNQIGLAPGDGRAEVDCLDVVLDPE
ncbi:family 43 glycosylhydrolase [Paludisphaera rhizosphaerae]|uniref:family 43 glycosylhydrolase n=1 Tax=Paludisphaera rhizosphaerae TaxID=2711216 RepID=UPI0013EDA5FD|nr:family 43 glycosylhydrolase [Paludisphaera rhizosphaerae]